MTAVLQINDRWRLGEDGELQWILERRKGEAWRAVGYCGTKTGLLEVALPHNRVAAPRPVLEALGRLPEHYQPGALAALLVANDDEPAYTVKQEISA